MMELKERRSAAWEKVKVILLSAILAILLLFAVMAGIAVHSLMQYGTQVQNIVSRLDHVTAELDELDIEDLVRTVNAVSDALGDADAAELLATIQDISLQLQEIDYAELGENLNGLLLQAQEGMARAEEALALASETIDAIDIEALNAAITDLKTVIQPLASFANRFG